MRANQNELTLKVDRAVSALTVALRCQPTIGEMAIEVGAGEEVVIEALQASRRPSG